jgi:hypothetical protein
MLKMGRLLVQAAVVLVAMACSGGAQDPVPTYPLDLVKQDLQALQTESFNGVSRLDPILRERFIDMFGGTSSVEVRKYFHSRLNYFLYPSLSGYEVSPSTFKYQGWTKPARPSKGGPSTIAFNLGSMFWLQSLVDGTPVSIADQGTVIHFDSHQSNVVQLSAQYTDVHYFEDGTYVRIPAAFRLGVLAHEARHSDCTGGVTEEDLENMRSAVSYEDFLQRSPRFECAHFHSVCVIDPGGPEIPACDEHSWGSYMFSWVYAEAMAADPDKSEHEKQLLNSMAISFKQRLRKFDVDAVMADTHQKPNMTGQGMVKR